MLTSRRHRVGVVLLVAAGLLAWSLRGFDPVEAWRVLGSAHLIWVATAAASLAVALGLRAVRGQVLLAEDAPSWRAQLRSIGAGFLAINVLPLRAGEFLRPWLLHRHGVELGRSVALVVAERLLDLMALMTLVGVVAFAVPLPGETLLVGGVDVLGAARASLGMVMGLLVGLVAGVSVLGPWVADRLGQIPVVGTTLRRVVLGFAQALAVLWRQPLRAGGAVMLTVGVWLCSFGTVMALLRGFDGLPHALDTALTVFVATLSGVLVVPTPGGVGPFEAFAGAALTLFGVSGTQAATFALTWHALQLSVVGLLGTWGLVGEGLSVADLAPPAPDALPPQDV